MAFPKFEDWEAPWKDDEKFDAEKAKKLIYGLSKDKHSQGERITSLREENDTLKDEKDDLTDEVATLKAGGSKKSKDGQGSDDDSRIADAVAKALEAHGVKPQSTKEKRKAAEATNSDSSLETARLEIALDKGLTKAQAARLSGKTREELEADADAYIEEHGLGSAEGGKSGGKGGQAPPSRQPKVTTGSRQRASDDVDDDDVDDPGALYDKVHGRA